MEKKIAKDSSGWTNNYDAIWYIDELKNYDMFMNFVGRFAKAVGADEIRGDVDHDFGNLDMAMRLYNSADEFMKDITELKDRGVGSFDIGISSVKMYLHMSLNCMSRTRPANVMMSCPDKNFIVKVDKIIESLI